MHHTMQINKVNNWRTIESAARTKVNIKRADSNFENLTIIQWKIVKIFGKNIASIFWMVFMGLVIWKII